MAWSRAGGTLLAILGLIALLAAMGGDSLLDRWPMLIAALLLFVGAHQISPLSSSAVTQMRLCSGP